jgi:dipeptidyl aminopeptidase/acylaminoacyl peptidase
LVATAVILIAATYSWSQDESGSGYISAEDLLALKSVSDPQVSPDGKWVAYTVERADVEADESSTQIFMVASDGASVRVCQLLTPV